MVKMRGYLFDKILLEETTLPKVAQKIILDPVDEIIVLPDLCGRLKNLMEGLLIEIGVLIDYPLGSGTLSKIIFEINNARKNGATKFYVPIPLYLLQMHQLDKLVHWMQELNFATYDSNDIYFLINTSELKEVQKIDYSKMIQIIQLNKLAIMSSDYQKVTHDEEVFKFDNNCLIEIKLLIQNEVADFETDNPNIFVRLSERGELNA